MSVQESANEVAAGPFLEWLLQFRASLRGTQGMDVPCGECVGCCVSGYPVWLRPGDQLAVARIPGNLLSTPEGMPPHHSLMQALPDGRCPMLRGRGCSIYDDRPQTCRDYDCRIFAAAGIDAGGMERAVINRRVHEWRFSYPQPRDVQAHEAVRAAARFIREHADGFPGRVPTAPTGIAVLAIKAYAVFLDPQADPRAAHATALAVIRASREFDAGTAAD